jgi:hypothetical protein
VCASAALGLPLTSSTPLCDRVGLAAVGIENVGTDDELLSMVHGERFVKKNAENFDMHSHRRVASHHFDSD